MEIHDLSVVLAAAHGTLDPVVVVLHNELVIAQIGCNLIAVQSLDPSDQLPG
jgi:hypothetical protein